MTYLTITEAGRALSRKYDAEYFSSLVPALEVIPGRGCGDHDPHHRDFFIRSWSKGEIPLKNDKTDFTQGSILKKLALFMLPILGALVLQAAYGAVDLLVVGRFGSTSGLSAVSTGSQVLNLVTFVVTQLAMGVTVLIARYLGEKKHEFISPVIGGAAVVFTLLAAVLFGVLVFLARPISSLMQAPARGP